VVVHRGLEGVVVVVEYMALQTLVGVLEQHVLFLEGVQGKHLCQDFALELEVEDSNDLETFQEGEVVILQQAMRQIVH
jgi:hypothetical protein